MQSRRLPLGSKIGIIGGGQLGRMTALAAAPLGFEPVIFGQEGDPAFGVTPHRLNSDFDDGFAVAQFAELVDVATVETENVPLELLHALEARGVPVRPSSHVIGIAQNRAKEKAFAAAVGVATVPYIAGDSRSIWDHPQATELLPGILKTTTGGYDGKFQAVVNTSNELLAALKPDREYVLEQLMPLEQEISVLVARDPAGHLVYSRAVVNVHENGILSHSEWNPRDVLPEYERTAQHYAMRLARELKLEGVLVVEFFVAGGKVYFNEMAPRSHNSFHASKEAAFVSQFGLHVRSITGVGMDAAAPDLVLGKPALYQFHTSWRMENLLGYTSECAEQLQSRESEWVYHWYGKKQARPDRKMGHRVICPISNRRSVPAMDFGFEEMVEAV